MTDISDDDLANNYGPTTPAPPPKKGRTRASGKPIPGPSTKPQSKAAKSRKPATKAANTIELEDEEDEDVPAAAPAKKRKTDSDDSSEVVALPGPPKGKGKKASIRTGSATNGVSEPATAKGKTRADPPSKDVQPNGTSGEHMEVDKDGVLELDEDEPLDLPPQRAVRGASSQAKTKTGAAAAARQARVEQKQAREVESLRAQLEQTREHIKEVAAQRDKLAKQLEDVLQLRQTEAEQALTEYKAHFDDSTKRKDSLIQELTVQLSKLQSPSKSPSYTLHFLTREAAEEEKRALQDENNRLNEVIKQRDATIAEKGREIAAFQQEVDITKKELDAEIERSKTLVSRNSAPAAARSTKPTSAGPSNRPVVQLYEDMTNILVTNVRFEKSQEWPELDEEILTCMFLYNNAQDNIDFALSFTLRNIWDKPEGHPLDQPLSRDQLLRKVKYQPKELDKESPDTVQRLQFFKDPFIFSRDQMTVFLKTITDTVSEMFEPEGEERMDGIEEGRSDGPGAGDEVIELE